MRSHSLNIGLESVLSDDKFYVQNSLKSGHKFTSLVHCSPQTFWIISYAAKISNSVLDLPFQDLMIIKK